MAELPLYRVLERSFINGVMYEQGSEVTYEGDPGTNLEPINAPAKPAAKKAAEARLIQRNKPKDVTGGVDVQALASAIVGAANLAKADTSAKAIKDEIPDSKDLVPPTDTDYPLGADATKVAPALAAAQGDASTPGARSAANEGQITDPATVKPQSPVDEAKDPGHDAKMKAREAQRRARGDNEPLA